MRPSDVLSVQSDRGLARRVLGKTRMLQFGVIADDLTGAMDTGLQFAQLGLRTIVYLEPARVDIDAVPVLDTESRDVAFDLAYAKVRDSARRLKGRVVYKKIDSTLRGNIGWEVDAVMDELDLSLALVSPAFPANGRTTRDGYLLVRGVRLRQTDFAADPLCPPTDHIPSLLQRQSNRSVRHIGVEVVEQGAEALLDDIRQGLGQILVVDAVSDTHLSTIARAIESLGESCLACGSAGLAQALPEAFHLEPTQRPPGAVSEMVDLPVLVVAGSLRQATRTQIEKAVSLAGAALIEIDPTDLEAGTKRALVSARRHLADGTDVIVTPSFRPCVADKTQAVAQCLGDVTAGAAAAQPLAGLVLTGGSVAFAVCRALGISMIEIQGEIAPGIPVGRALGGEWNGIRLVTKAGGFGEEKVLAQAIEYLRMGDRNDY